MAAKLIQVSVVVPVGAGDATWQNLLRCLPTLPDDWELVLIMAKPVSEEIWRELIAENQLTSNKISWCVAAAAGRARQMNQGGVAAKGRWVWFLHADSQIDLDHIRLVQKTIQFPKMALFYFDLAFDQRGFSLIRFNQWGANLRSRVFGMPFGDQGFLLELKLWQQLGKFDVKAAYGEDHLFVWTCKLHRVALCRLPLAIRTSPRKYYRGGWLSTTLTHIILTWKQAIPEIWKLVRRRIGLEK